MTTFAQHKRTVKSNLETDLTFIDNNIRRYTEMYKHNNTPILQGKIDGLEVEKSGIERKLARINTGEADTELAQEIKTNSDTFQVKAKQAQHKKATIKIDETDRKKNMDTIMKKERTQDKTSRRDFTYHYYRYMKLSEKLPSFMREKLQNMPGNKGYIWNGIWFFGDLPEEKYGKWEFKGHPPQDPADYYKPIVMFEKRPYNPILYIHEIDRWEHRTYEKNGKAQKVLTSTKQRRVKIQTR